MLLSMGGYDSRMKAKTWAALEWVVYISAALLAIAPALRENHVVGDGVDMYGTIWFYWWIQQCIETWSDPGFTDWFFYPLGKDIFAHTGNNFVDAVFAAPFYWLFGSPGYHRWFILALLLANAASFRVFAKGVFTSRLAVAGATLLWMLNPYVLFEITCGRSTQAFLVFLPLAFHFLIQMEKEQLGWRRFGVPILAGVLVALQGWTYWFMGYFMALVMLPMALWALWRSASRRELALRYLVAGISCLVCVAPAALAISGLADQGDVPGLTQASDFSLFEPPAALGNNVSPFLHGWIFAEFMGTPLLISFAWTPLLLAWLFFGRDRLRFVVGFFAVWLMAIGPVIHPPVPSPPVWAVDPLYMAAYHYLPFFDRLWFPYRMVVMCFFILSFGAGQLLDRLAERGLPKWAPAVLVAIFMGVTLGEQARLRVFPFVTKDLTLPATYQMVKDNPGKVIHLPFGISQPSIVWQTFHEQKMFGGMGENASILLPPGFDKRLKQNQFIRSLVQIGRSPLLPANSYPESHRMAFEEEGFRWVILHRDLQEGVANQRGVPKPETFAFGATERLVEILGPPVAVEGVLVTWDLSGEHGPLPGHEAGPGLLTTRDWSSDLEAPAYERALQDAGRLPGPPQTRRDD